MKKLLIGITLLASASSFASFNYLLDKDTYSINLVSDTCEVSMDKSGRIRMEKANGSRAGFKGEITQNSSRLLSTKLKTSVSHHEQEEGKLRGLLNDIPAETIELTGKVERDQKTYSAEVTSKLDGTIVTTSCSGLRLQ
jgi:hypothetical protein